jgi:Tol biopolymer transport system component
VLKEIVAALTVATLSVAPVPFGLFPPGTADGSVTMAASFTPDGATVYYAKAQPGYKGLTIFESHLSGGSWSAPDVAPFSGVFRDTDPTVTPDGNAVVYASARPPGGDGLATYKLWISYIAGQKAGTTQALPDSINAEGSEGHPGFARDGTLYFDKTVNGVSRIYFAARRGDAYAQPQAIAFRDDGPQVRDGDPAIAPDQRFIVFASNRPASKGPAALYASFHRQGVWCTPMILDSPINTGLEFAPELSPDGQTLYFASARSSLVQPRAVRASAASFQNELSEYAHGAVRIYSSAIGDWIRAHEDDPC